MERYPVLSQCAIDIENAYLILEECYNNDGKLLIASNSGQVADSERIQGKLLKRFNAPRPVTAEFAEKLKSFNPVRGENLSHNLECGQMVNSLVDHEALSTAYINDVDGYGVFVQQLFGFSCLSDVFLCISRSSNNSNVMSATVVVRAL